MQSYLSALIGRNGLVLKTPTSDGSSRYVMMTDGSKALFLDQVSWNDLSNRPSLSGTNTGDQTITLTGDATGSGTGSFSVSVTKTNGVVFATSATTDTTNASNISTGTLGAAHLPTPTAGTLGGIESIVGQTSKWISSISLLGVPVLTQPQATDISGLGSAATLTAGAANGVATLDGSGKLSSSQIPASLVGAVVYQGTWNANTNSPALVSGVGTKGFYYKVSTAGATTIDGISQWNIGDTIIFDGTVWDKIDGIANEVISVFGRTGAVLAQTGDYTATQVGLGNVVNALQLQAANNLSDVASATTAKSNIGLGNVTNDAQTKSAIVPNTAPSAGQLLIGNAGNTAYAAISLSGDATLASTGVFTLGSTITGGSIGSSTSIPTLTYDAKGRLTAATGNAVIAPAGTLSGTTLNSTVVTSSLTTVGTSISFGSSFSVIAAPSDGLLVLSNHAQTGFTSLQLGSTVASPTAVSLLAGSVVTGTSNTGGASFTIAGSQGTGTGTGGSLVFQVSPAGSTGTTPNALVTALTIDSTQTATFSAVLSVMLATNATSGAAGISFSTSSNATSGNQKFSPRFRQSGQGFGGSASVRCDWTQEVRPIQGVSTPTSQFVVSSQIGGGSINDCMTLSSDMSVSLAGALTVTGTINNTTLTASQIVGTDGSKNLISVATTGSGSVVLATSPTLSSPIVGTQPPNDGSTKAASTSYVDTAINTAITAQDGKPSVAYASTSALPANTYANGTSGVGATLTGNSNGPLIIDGVTILVAQVGERVLVTGESTQANNGWYTITQVGVIAVSPYILTRATESDQATEIGAGYVTSVVAPNTVTAGANNGKVFVSVAIDPFVVGTTALSFSQVGSVYTQGTGITISSNVINVNASQTQITAVGTLVTGTWNAGVVAGQYGGTGVANTGSTITLGGNLTTSGAFALTLTQTATTTVTLPTSGTLSTLAGSESLTNKTITMGGSLTISAQNIVTDTTTGTKIGTATGQKIAFFNSTPVVQQTGDATTALSNLGLVTSATFAAANLTGGTIAGGVGFSQTSYSGGTLTSGTYTPAASNGNVQHITNGGAFTLAPPATVCTIIVEITNNGSAGAITTSSFTKVTGDSFTTVNASKFQCFLTKSQNGSTLNVLAMQ